jgi:hypothetical protein
MAEEAENFYDTPVSQIRKRDDGVIEIRMKKNVEIDLENTKRNTTLHRALASGEKAPFLIILEPFASITKEARDWHGLKMHSEYRLAEAVVAKDLAQRIILKFYANFYKRDHPVRIFTEQAEGEKWLKEMRVKAAMPSN